MQTRRRAAQALFVSSIFTVPVPFFMLFVVALVPLACTVTWFVRPLPGAAFNGEGGSAIVKQR